MTRLVYVTRKFPPQTGGMELLAQYMWQALAADDNLLIANRRSNRVLPWWLPLQAVRTAVAARRRRVDIVVAGDAVVAIALLPLMPRRSRTAVVLHGLDITFENRIYQWLMRRTTLRAEIIVAISGPTAEHAIAAGVPPERLHIVPLALDIPRISTETRTHARRQVATELGIGEDRPLLVTVGRLVERKGVAWFVTEVLPELASNPVLIVAGTGPEHPRLIDLARTMGDRIRILGSVDDRTRDLVVRAADLFVQPNVPIPGDIEGFGLVALEATHQGTAVVAAALGGLVDALDGGSSGILLPTRDAQTWIDRLDHELRDLDGLRAKGRRFEANSRAAHHPERFRVAVRDALGLT